MLSVKQRNARIIAKIGRLELIAQDRWYISLNVKGGYNRKTGKWDRYVWPKLFHSEEAAWLFARLMDPFRHPNAPGRIKSYTVEKVRR